MSRHTGSTHINRKKPPRKRSPLQGLVDELTDLEFIFLGSETSFELLAMRGARYKGFRGEHSTCFDFIWVCINETGASKRIKEAPFSLAVSYLAS